MKRVPVILRIGVRKNKVERSGPDARDHHLLLLNYKASTPTSINLKSQLPYVFDQGPIGSCTANSTGYMYSWVVQKNNSQLFIPSRLFLYYNTRMIEGTISYDSGATLRNTLKSLKNYGVCAETSWPYQ